MTDYPNEIQRFYYETLKWCGCGNPDEALQLMRIVLGTMHRRSAVNLALPFGSPRSKSAWPHYSKRLQRLLPGALGLSYLYMLDAHGLTEHGGNVSGSWLTKEGARILALLKASDLDAAMGED